jgi:uncharacterized sulfatase
MVRTPEWKLVRHFERDGQDEMYHLAEDPGEKHNLHSSTEPKHESQRTTLAHRLEVWMTRIGDIEPTDPVPQKVKPNAGR